ncbi:gluconolactonase [Sphingorhabdus pulchriflava]|uniref:Gluconolactonase n=2 Tax=Sphingorhabdus pulchriflava TaxID=2292257 RepID=A0A371BJR5_9SPHN|nr:SMP-30/gluconolactonase/LRE family protein [Sphingorhabdus pulchriflava]RDV07828.1 gluconolactonase [Sphingorhabdus pulchriflava]
MELIADQLGFPEGPVVMGDGSVIVVEIAASRVSRCWSGKRETICEIGGGPNGAAIGPDGALYICNNGGMDAKTMSSAFGPEAQGRIERLDLTTGKVERVYDACDGVPLEGPNDIVFDADGRMWFTDLGKTFNGIRTASGLFTALPDGTSITAIDRRAVSYNGIGLCPNGNTVYVADTHQARLYSYARKVEAQRPNWVATAPGHVSFDSLAVTAAGNICVGTLREGGITTVTSEGETSFRSFDDRYVTNIAFGGEDMMDAYLTLSTTGRLVKVRWIEPGLRLNFNA